MEDEFLLDMRPTKRTILIVDDERGIRSKYKKFLKKEGFRVLEAPNALEVANLLMREKSTLDLILLDINMREVDGRDIFDIIDEYAPSLQVIVSSIFPLHDQKLKIPRAADYFNKSHKKELLLSKIKKILGVSDLKSVSK